MILLMIFVLGVTPIVFGESHQQKEGQESGDIYRQVPEDRRQALRQTVDKLLEAEQQADWKVVYQLLDRKSGETEEGFLKKVKGRRPLREFRPSKVTFIPPDDAWVIRGCASFEDDPKDHGHLANIRATWSDSRWHLSLVSFALVGNEKGGKLQDCSIP